MDRGVLWVVYGVLHRDHALLRESLDQHRSLQCVHR